MAVTGINHYTVIGYDLEAAKQFYIEIVGLTLLNKRTQGVTTYIDFTLPGRNEPLVRVIDANVEIAKNERDVGFQLHGTAGKNGKKEFSSGALSMFALLLLTVISLMLRISS